MENGNRNQPTSSQSKVARLIEEYGLEGMGDDLEAYWTAEEEERRMSLRELVTHFNREMLRSELKEHRGDVLAGEVENLYKLLTDEDVTSGVRTQAENRLRKHGIDVKRLKSNFVSRQAIHTYLTKYRDAEYESVDNNSDLLNRRFEQLQRLRSRQTTVTEQTLASLRDREDITLGEFQVLVSVRVQCNDCGRQFDVAEIMDRGGCDCTSK